MSGGKVWLVGAGPGDPGLLTIKGARAIQHCEVLVYDALASRAIIGLAPTGCDLIDAGKRAGDHVMRQDEINALLVRLGAAGKRVVRLKGGDPFVFGRGGEEAYALRAAGVPFEIVPGITSAIAAPAYAGIPVTHRAHNATLTIVTGHEDPTKGKTSLDFAKLANPKSTAVFLMAVGNLPGIVAELQGHGLSAETPAALVRDGTQPTQQTVIATLGTIVEAAERARITAPAVFVVGEVVREREAIRWFDSQPLFGKRVLVTRPEPGAGEMALQLWDAGAQPLLAPTIAIGPPDDPAAAAHAVAYVRDNDWLVFTSRNGVDAFFALLAERGRDARALADVRVAAIGPHTAAALAGRGIVVDFSPTTAINEAVAEGLLERTNLGDRILLFRAQEAREVLPETLREAGRAIEVVAGYRTHLVDDPQLREKAELADIVTFTSASTVQGFVHNVPAAAELLAERLVAVIGPITGTAARELGIRVDVVASEFTVEGLVHALGAAVPA